MSRIYVDRISPYQSGSVQVDGLSLDTGSLTTKTEFNAYTASNDSVVNALTAATSSYLTNLPTGIVSGSSQISYTGLTNIPTGIVSGSDQVTSSLDSRYVNNTGNETISGRKTFTGNSRPIEVEGDVRITGNAEFQIRYSDLDTFTFDRAVNLGLNLLDLYNFDANGEDEIQIKNVVDGSDPRGIYNNRNIAISLPSSNSGTSDITVHENLIVSGAVSITDTMELAGLDPLPTGSVGQLAVSASNLYYHDGSNWSQIN
jgi:hypothetical protein